MHTRSPSEMAPVTPCPFGMLSVAVNVEMKDRYYALCWLRCFDTESLPALTRTRAKTWCRLDHFYSATLFRVAATARINRLHTLTVGRHHPHKRSKLRHSRNDPGQSRTAARIDKNAAMDSALSSDLPYEPSSTPKESDAEIKTSVRNSSTSRRRSKARPRLTRDERSSCFLPLYDDATYRQALADEIYIWLRQTYPELLPWSWQKVCMAIYTHYCNELFSASTVGCMFAYSTLPRPTGRRPYFTVRVIG
jgi:hypothetical protein